MKIVKGIVLGLFVIGINVFLSSLSFADKGPEKEKIKLLNDSAAVLLQSNPKLSDGLTKFANEEAAEKEEHEGKKELEGAKEEEMEKHHVDRIQLLKDSAAALQASHPEMAESLTKMADHMAKRMAEKKEGKEDTKEAEEKEIKDKK